MGTQEFSMNKKARPNNWLDVPWLVFLAGLAVLPPFWEWHKQVTLLAIGVVQLFEARVVARYPRQGPVYVVLLKIALATLLIDHTGEISINSSYYPIYFVPVITAALYFGPLVTLLWTLLASAAYSSFLYPALKEYSIDTAGFTVLAIRIFFFFLVAMVVNRVVVAYRAQSNSYQHLAEQLTETNRELERAHAETRRSERLAALGQLTAGLAHEIRNPLGIIKGSAEMLNQKLENTNPLAAELAGYISSEVNRLSALVSRFLDFARPLQATCHQEDVAESVERALRSVVEQWSGGKITVEKAYQQNLPLVPLDAGLCEQVFVNLLQNAFEAMGDEGGVLRLEVEESQFDGRSGVEVRIRDSGPGIAPDLREQIFNPFVTTKNAGVGLGLSIVSQIMDEHHGSIRLLEMPGGGAGFGLFFPL
jgi:two-component system, NtrC family, sensor histidine kinase HydH